MSRPTDAEWSARAERSAGVRVPVRGALATVELLPPHASLRRYARARFDDGGTEIVMMMPSQDAPPDEAGGAARPPITDDPFVVVTRWLRGIGVPVPELLAIDEDGDALWLEDLGGTDFDAWVSSAPDAVEARYERALDLLVHFQNRTEVATAPALVRDRRFDAEILRWELDHYVEWRLEAWLGKTLSPAVRGELDARFDALVAELAAIPTHVMHRDFQSHNIMVRDGALVLLDHQDAMIGPAVYDSVALLRDSYVRLPVEVLVRLVDRYARSVAGASFLPDASPSDIQRWFHMQTVQRKLKDAARFVYIDRVKGNPSFLGYIDDSAAYVREAFQLLGGELAPLADVLADLDPEVVA